MVIYHQRAHRGIGTTPIAAWISGSSRTVDVRRPSDSQKFYIDFLPGESRLIRRDGIQLSCIHYWDNALSPVAGRGKQKHLVRYDPRDLSHVYVKDRPGAQYITVPYRDLSHPPITQSEHRAVLKILRRNKNSAINERTVFAAILKQRALVEKSRKDTATARREREKMNARKPALRREREKPAEEKRSEKLQERVEPYKVEVWE